MTNISKYTLVGTLAIIVIAISLPFSSYAATKQVGQDFNWQFTYFPQADGSAIVFSDGQFYQSNQPTVDKDWQSISLSTQGLEEFIPGVAVPFKKYTYVISGPEETVGMSSDVQRREIWRLSKTAPTTLEKVFSLDVPTGDAINQFRDLAVFKNALYASDSEGRLWQSTNGTNWQNLTLIGLPENTYMNTLYSSKSTLYAQTENAIYFSKHGTDWKNLADKYSILKTQPVQTLTMFLGQLYVVVNDGSTQQVLKLRYNGKVSQVFVGDASQHDRLFATEKNLYLVENDSLANSYVLHQLVNGAFEEQHHNTGSIQDRIQTNSKVLFVVNNSGTISLWR